MNYRNYNPEKDKDAIHRIWRETGWLEEGREECMDLLVECGRALVADVNEEPECLVITAPGVMRYLNEDLSLSAVTGVTTSRIARKQGLAKRLTAAAVAADAADGALVSALGIFDEGYYNQLGFGTLGYDHWVRFDPSRLRVMKKPRIPRRIAAEDWEEVHQCRLRRLRLHGGCNVTPAQATRSQMVGETDLFGLGFFDGEGDRLSHHFWCRPSKGEHGFYSIYWMAYQTWDQFLELMALIRTLGDQVYRMDMCEPPGIQMQDLLDRPFYREEISEKSTFETGIRAHAGYQVRICNLEGCLAHTHLSTGGVHLNLKLKDPITTFLERTAPWRGLTGEYVVTLGPHSSAKPGVEPRLPILSASVGALTRLWLGVLPATSLAVTEELSGPPDLLRALDRIICVPKPSIDWGF